MHCIVIVHVSLCVCNCNVCILCVFCPVLYEFAIKVHSTTEATLISFVATVTLAQSTGFGKDSQEDWSGSAETTFGRAGS